MDRIRDLLLRISAWSLRCSGMNQLFFQKVSKLAVSCHPVFFVLYKKSGNIWNFSYLSFCNCFFLERLSLCAIGFNFCLITIFFYLLILLYVMSSAKTRINLYEKWKCKTQFSAKLTIKLRLMNYRTISLQIQKVRKNYYFSAETKLFLSWFIIKSWEIEWNNNFCFRDLITSFQLRQNNYFKMPLPQIVSKVHLEANLNRSISALPI